MNRITEEQLRAMKISEEVKLSNWRWLIRVPNGWVYETQEGPTGVCFVPDGSLARIEDRLREIRGRQF